MTGEHSVVCVKTCIVSDVRIYREGIGAALAAVPGLEAVADAHPGPDAIDRIAAARADVIVVDMGGAAAAVLVRSIRQLIPDARIVAFGVDESEDEILACAEAGVAGYVCRDASTKSLVEAVRNAAKGELVCSPRVAASLFRRVASLADRAGASADALTLRERQVLGLIRAGLGNKQIAEELNIAEATVKNHVHNVLEKLHVKRRAQAARVDSLLDQRRTG